MEQTIKPMIRGNICLNVNPEGLARSVQKQIAYVKKAFDGKKPDNAHVPKLALIAGCSTGYGLASRIAAAFGFGTATVGVSFEKAPSGSRAGTPGFYNNAEFDKAAREAGLLSLTIDGDAFSDAAKDSTIEAIRKLGGQADLFVYSLASPVRTDPKSGVMYRSVIKPVGNAFSGKTLDIVSSELSDVRIEPASPEEISSTVKVMGGEDWELWIDALEKAGVLAPNARTVAYTYIGPELSHAIYKNGTIGRAKEDLERAAKALNQKWQGSGKSAWVSVNKALVTRASAVIPTIPLYVSALFKVMKAKGLHEGCIEQITRLYRERLYTGSDVPVDADGRIRIDDWEMRDDVQREVAAIMPKLNQENIAALTDIEGFKRDFLEAHGF